jgi:hypothetical protein
MYRIISIPFFIFYEADSGSIFAKVPNSDKWVYFAYYSMSKFIAIWRFAKSNKDFTGESNNIIHYTGNIDEIGYIHDTIMAYQLWQTQNQKNINLSSLNNVKKEQKAVDEYTKDYYPSLPMNDR